MPVIGTGGQTSAKEHQPVMRNLRLLDNKKKENTRTATTRAVASGIYGGWFNGRKKETGQDYDGKNDEERQVQASEDFAQYEETATMESYISDMVNQMNGTSASNTSLNKKPYPNTRINTGSTGTAQNIQPSAPVSFDPRISRYDAFRANDAVIPFTSETASSVYYDMVFSVEKAVAKMDPNYKSGNNTGESGTSASDRVATNEAEVKENKNDPDLYGTQSLMNPYCVTRLVGGLTGTPNRFTTHMYDIRDTKRFYDNTGFGGGPIVETENDFVSITNPTTTNIITWSNKDKWGRTPYSFHDFVFCKWWNIIPNNRLITLRKYAVPTYDNLNFPNMEDSSTDEPKIVAPIATVVSYFGGESPNKLNDFINFTTGTPWKDLTADVHNVSGDTGDDPRAVIDRIFEHSSGFGGVGSDSGIINKFLGAAGGLTGQYFSFAKFVGLISPDGYTGHSQESFMRLTEANVDPTEQIYSNRIYGPVNRIQSVKRREPGIEFSQSFKLVCEYVARPIGGVNPKAAMLDILANCMEIASAEAVFWGGGYRFNIKPHLYPFKNTKLKNNVMANLYAGKIFGQDGAISSILSGVKSFATDSAGNFQWSTVTERIGDILGQTVGGIGSMLQSVSSTLFGETNQLNEWIGKGIEFLGGDIEQGENAVQNFTNNLNKMWSDHIIQQTVMPSVSGMKALLTGDPVGNWHLTVGNPLNPIMVVGNLICTNMHVEMGEELGPDDFPMSLKVTYTIEHGMPRDKAAIQSMFNRGAGKIYKLPDYIRATSDYETRVDNYTGYRNDGESWVTPGYMNAKEMMDMNGARGYQTMKYDVPKQASNSGNPATTFIAKFTPPDPQRASEWLFDRASHEFLQINRDSRALYFPNLHTQKSTDN